MMNYSKDRMEHIEKQRELEKLFTEKEYPCKTGLDFIDYCKRIQNDIIKAEGNETENPDYYIGKKQHDKMTEGCKAYVFKFAHKMKTIEAEFIYDIFKKGRGYFIESEIYNDFINSVFCKLWDLAFDRPCETMETLLFLATKEGIKECFSEYSDIIKRASGKDASGKRYRYYKRVESLDSLKESGFEADASTSVYYTDDIETAETNRAIIKTVSRTLTQKLTLIYKAIAVGMKYADIAKAMNTSEDVIKQTIKRHRDRVKRELEKVA